MNSVKNDTLQGEQKGADEKVRVCPACHEGWERVVIDRNGIKDITIEWYGDWWNLRRGKKISRCPRDTRK